MRAYEIPGWDKGTKIRQKSWDKGQYIYRNHEREWVGEDGFKASVFEDAIYYHDEWEPYVEEPELIEVKQYRPIFKREIEVDGKTQWEFFNSDSWSSRKNAEKLLYEERTLVIDKENKKAWVKKHD